MIILGAILGAIAYRLRGGWADLLIGKLLKKPTDWTPSNVYGRSLWALFITLSLPLGWHSIYIFGFAYLGVLFGYFGGEFNLAEKGNRTWKNYSLLSARGAFIILPLALTYGSLYSHLWLGVLGGALMPLCYLADSYLKKYVNLNWGEALVGLIIGLTLFV